VVTVENYAYQLFHASILRAIIMCNISLVSESQNNSELDSRDVKVIPQEQFSGGLYV
jgi:hypothetical protein